MAEPSERGWFPVHTHWGEDAFQIWFTQRRNLAMVDPFILLTIFFPMLGKGKEAKCQQHLKPKTKPKLKPKRKPKQETETETQRNETKTKREQRMRGTKGGPFRSFTVPSLAYPSASGRTTWTTFGGHRSCGTSLAILTSPWRSRPAPPLPPLPRRRPFALGRRSWRASCGAPAWAGPLGVVPLRRSFAAVAADDGGAVASSPADASASSPETEGVRLTAANAAELRRHLEARSEAGDAEAQFRLGVLCCLGGRSSRSCAHDSGSSRQQTEEDSPVIDRESLDFLIGPGVLASLACMRVVWLPWTYELWDGVHGQVVPL